MSDQKDSVRLTSLWITWLVLPANVWFSGRKRWNGYHRNCHTIQCGAYVTVPLRQYKAAFLIPLVLLVEWCMPSKVALVGPLPVHSIFHLLLSKVMGLLQMVWNKTPSQTFRGRNLVLCLLEKHTTSPKTVMTGILWGYFTSS